MRYLIKIAKYMYFFQNGGNRLRIVIPLEFFSISHICLSIRAYEISSYENKNEVGNKSKGIWSPYAKFKSICKYQ